MNLEERNKQINRLFEVAIGTWDPEVITEYQDKALSSDTPLPLPIFWDIELLYYKFLGGKLNETETVKLIQLLAMIGAREEALKFQEAYGFHDIIMMMDISWFLTVWCKPILFKKGSDYQKNNNAYSNFKNAAKRVGVTPREILKSYIDKQYCVVEKVIYSNNYGSLLSDSLSERIADMINYIGIDYVAPVEEAVPSNQPELPFGE